tara:strand:+ start:397 stop:567 length:171 start_codon:yes stop_codon:yes gene_type:complete
MTETVKLKRGDKVITRSKEDYNINKTVWEHRGFTILEATSLLDKIKKKKPKKKSKK